ncbi:hypothetical protein N7532_003217 [Penicillium argentinense]|uniref:NAD(P)-binding domain-containing protein n=1 Tax=Penicillium argentinense TaxID=1131581 RepID=A0A9W9KEF7_9EURO|nr:uncharacterized protein N7532_003217 [Penicillium argentinense]KAJ5102688.1 hypothetical protein N7532_003217 [Penicillium argentinense]
MKVLVLGSTGNLGSRVLSALLAREHSVVAFLRDPSKLPPSIVPKLTAVERGDAKKASDIKVAASKHQCDAIVNTAGLAAMAPWGKSDLPTIVDAVIAAALEIGQERQSPLRVWFLGGLGLLDQPQTKYLLVDYVRMFPEHRSTWAKLKALPPSSMEWSILCPSMMTPRSKDSYPLASGSSSKNIVVSAGAPPQWSPRFFSMPLVGGWLNVISQIGAFNTTLEDNADFIAQDLSDGNNSEWIYQRVGTRTKTE